MAGRWEYLSSLWMSGVRYFGMADTTVEGEKEFNFFFLFFLRGPTVVELRRSDLVLPSFHYVLREGFGGLQASDSARRLPSKQTHLHLWQFHGFSRTCMEYDEHPSRVAIMQAIRLGGKADDGVSQYAIAMYGIGSNIRIDFRSHFNTAEQ